jgi:hypothetical protein
VPSLLLGPLLRYVDSSSATIWVQTDVACDVEILGARERTWSVEGHHFALVLVELPTDAKTSYTVRLDGEQVWPPADRTFPPSAIRPLDGGDALEVAFGSCRIALPHTPPYVLRSHEHPKGHGIDALRAYALRGAQSDGEALPALLLLLGDQIYADQPSPALKQALADRPRPDDAPADELANFAEYALAYRETWSDPAIRWLLSTVPTAMIFDDHEIHDEWRISERWMRKMSAKPWFDDHIRAGLTAYWVFQHLGNMSPEELVSSEVYRELRAGNEEALATAMNNASHQTGHSRWSYSRELNHTRLVVIDSRAGRNVTPGRRELVSDDEWDWIRSQAREPARHLLLASSVPFLLTPGLHHVEAWDEAITDGAWGSAMAWVGERLRMAAVMDHWASFQHTYRKFAKLIEDVAHGDEGGAPASVVMLSGDVHHCYVAEVGFRPGAAPLPSQTSSPRAVVWQAVCSAFRKELAPHERVVIGFGHSRLAERLARRLSRAAGVAPLPFDWRVLDRPAFANQIGTLKLSGDDASVRIEAVVDGTWNDPQLQVVIDRKLTGAKPALPPM